MTKQESQIMKGVAIIMMLILHLFGKTNVGYMSVLEIGTEPIEYILRSAVNPVSFFLILSGYGMHYIFKSGKNDHKWSRILKLYVHWWVAILIFTILGGLIGIRHYYTDFNSVIANYTGYKCTWNYEGWFLFPYVGLMLVSSWIFRVVDKIRSKYVVFCMLLLGLCLGFVVSRYRDVLNGLIDNPLFAMFSLLPAFVIGSVFHREQIVSKVQNRNLQPFVCVALLLFLIVVVCTIGSAAMNTIYAMLFIVLFLAFPRWRFVDNVLAFLGNHSMNIWFTHTWFSNYLFHEQIYSLKYSVVILIVVLLLSLASSYLINCIVEGVLTVGKALSWVNRK